jgi:hypothetical protein
MNAITKVIFKAVAKRFGPMTKQSYLITGDFIKAFYEKTGQASLPIITKISENAGVKMAGITGKMASIRNMNDAGEMYGMMDSLLELGIQPVEYTENICHFKLKRCPYGLEGTSKELCEAMMAMDKKILSTLLGKDIEMQIPQSIAIGDKICEVVFKL